MCHFPVTYHPITSQRLIERVTCNLRTLILSVSSCWPNKLMYLYLAGDFQFKIILGIFIVHTSYNLHFVMLYLAIRIFECFLKQGCNKSLISTEIYFQKYRKANIYAAHSTSTAGYINMKAIGPKKGCVTIYVCYKVWCEWLGCFAFL